MILYNKKEGTELSKYLTFYLNDGGENIEVVVDRFDTKKFNDALESMDGNIVIHYNNEFSFETVIIKPDEISRVEIRNAEQNRKRREVWNALRSRTKNVRYQVEWKHDQSGEHTIHEVYDTHKEAMDSIYKWWLKNEYVPSYVRYWTINGVTKIDYGFHHMFYYIREVGSGN